MDTCRPKKARVRDQQREQQTFFALPEQEVEDDAKAFLELMGDEKVVGYLVDVVEDEADNG